MSALKGRAGPAKAGSKASAPVSLPHLLRVGSVAAALGLRVPTVYLWISRRKLPVVRLGRSVRVPAEALAALIAENTISAREELK